MTDLNGKTAIVTGGSSGIGAAIVARLAADGARVFSLDVCKPEGDAGLAGEHLDCDVRSLPAMCEAVAAVEAASGGLDIVVANAGVNLFGSVVDVDLEAAERCLDINVRGVINTLRATLPVLQRQRSGVVTVMGSDQAIVGKRNSAVYSATKGAVAQLAKCTALDAAPFGVRVNCVCPGTVETPAFTGGVTDFAGQYLSGQEQVLRRAVIAKVPLRRLGQPAEVAALVAFLSSDEAGYITGALLSIDGGYVTQ